MTTVQMGSDGRTHRVGPDGQALCRTPLVDAEPAEIDLGTATHSGLWSPGPIRIEP